jgi:hypothetical protein
VPKEKLQFFIYKDLRQFTAEVGKKGLSLAHKFEICACPFPSVLNKKLKDTT